MKEWTLTMLFLHFKQIQRELTSGKSGCTITLNHSILQILQCILQGKIATCFQYLLGSLKHLSYMKTGFCDFIYKGAPVICKYEDPVCASPSMSPAYRQAVASPP